MITLRNYFFLLILGTILCFEACTQKISSPREFSSMISGDHFQRYAQEMAMEAKFDISNYFLKKAIPIYSETENWMKLTRCYIQLGENYQNMGNLEDAFMSLNSALQVVHRYLGSDQFEIASGFQKLGFRYFVNRDYDRAIEMYHKALSIKMKALGENHPEVAKILNSMALIYFNKGDTTMGKDYYDRSISIKLKHLWASRSDIIKNYKFFDRGFLRKKEFPKDRLFFNKKLGLYMETYGSNHPLVATLYENIGILYALEGAYDQAMEYLNKSLSIRLKIFGDESQEVAECYTNIGVHFRLKGDYRQALHFLMKALFILKNTEIESPLQTAEIYYQMGKIYFLLNRLDEALSFYQESLIAMVPGFSSKDIYVNPDIRCYHLKDKLMEVLAGKAEALRMRYLSVPDKIEDIRTSFNTYLQVSTLIDMIRSGYKSEDYKIFFGEKCQLLFDAAIQSAIELYRVNGDDYFKNKAFILSEMSKASILLEAISESKAKKFSRIPDYLVEKDRKLRREMNLYDTYLEKEYQNPTRPKNLRLRDLEDHYFQLKLEHQKLIESFEKSYKDYYALKHKFRSISISNLQKAIEKDSLLVEYFVGRRHIHIFTVTATHLDIESVPIDERLNKRIEDYYYSIHKIEEKTYLTLSHWLYRLLIEPILQHIQGKRRIIIIPHGHLFYVPFESLISENVQTSDFRNLDYLIKHFACGYHYSASLWLQSVDKKRLNREASFVGFAPVFSEGIRKKYPIEANLYRIGNNMDEECPVDVYQEGVRFSELPGTKEELTEIANLFKASKKPATVFLHGDATEENFKAVDMKKVNFIHIATHGLINKDQPKLSGLIFSHHLNKTAKEDGILYSGEIYSLDLDAELVVLSSCEGGVGKLISGEGMMGLARGFFYSGVHNIIFSLWKVEDRPTCRLMVHTYRNVLADKRIFIALQQAKLALIKDRFTAFPKYWSGFILLGI